AKKLLDEEEIWYKGFKKGRGLIGALAAAGAVLPDFTYELIAYRERRQWGTPRRIDEESVWRADALTYPRTWDTVDHHNNRVVFAPHSQDPVLFGIRGSDPQAILEAFQTIKSESVERSVLYQTNQGTDAHILDGVMADVRDSESYRLHGFVAGPAQAIAGGHLSFPLQEDASRINCAAFEPTKNFRAVVLQLALGDELEVYGSVREGSLNLEKLNILHLAEKEENVVPICPECQRNMKSAGKGQGYRCRRCKTHAWGRVRRLSTRNLETGYYEVPPCARRHLSMPLIRMNDKKVHPAR
ncbi:MAG: tRNA(Ile)(2)-agmatinylcytidine synthase, partial [Methanothrix sp.]